MKLKHKLNVFLKSFFKQKSLCGAEKNKKQIQFLNLEIKTRGRSNHQIATAQKFPLIFWATIRFEESLFLKQHTK
jgi:hypothetical protein